MNKRFAHEIVAEPSSDALMRDYARYHVTRAVGFYKAMLGEGESPIAPPEAVSRFLPELHLAFIHYYADDGALSDEVVRESRERLQHPEGVGAWLHQAAIEYGVDSNSVRAYDLSGDRRQSGQEGTVTVPAKHVRVLLDLLMKPTGTEASAALDSLQMALEEVGERGERI